MKRVILGVFSLAIAAAFLADTAVSAPGRRAARGAGGAARAAGGGARNVVSGSAARGGRNHPGGPMNFGGGNLPTGPINGPGNFAPTPPQFGGSGFPGLQGGSMNVPDRLPDGSQFPGQFQDQLNNAQSAIQGQIGQMATAYGVNAGGPAPFSPAWYVDHPNAWQITHPYAGEAVVAATAVGLASFMAIETAAVSGGSTTVVYGGEATAEQTQAATELAESGEVAVDPNGKWMPVGVFAFRPTDAPNATRMIQLMVNPQGTIRGSHYDLLSEETADIVGAVDRNSAQVSWRIGKSGHVIFESTLAQLTQPQGQVRVHFPDGQSGQWAVTRLQQ